ncbi:glycosyltransferase family 2 protein [Anatilimnocola aggregata]|uniref:glycosyltransferase family 2 protein n=1 Tax=Anatilimnocola aggregata TaxID=2528021 RepID=UPI0011A11011|nr:glycosyltransferase family 2 protein [Anatilimnocola aggregata]
MPRLSIVIPCLGGATEFEDTLVSVLQNRPAQCEVIVVHALPYDDPYGLQDEVRFIRVSGKPGLVQLANTGIEAAKSEIVHILGCRLTVQEGWAETALQHFKNSQIAAVSPLIVAPHDQQVTAAGVSYGAGGRRKIVGAGLAQANHKLNKLKVAGPTLEAGFYRREALLALGGWQELVGDVAADVDLAQSLIALDLTTVVATDSVLHELRPAARSAGFAYGRALERLFWRQYASANPAWAIICHMLVVMFETATRLPNGDALTTLLGRAVGLMHAGTTSKYRHSLEQSRQALEAAAEPSTLSMSAAREERMYSAPETQQRRRAA